MFSDLKAIETIYNETLREKKTEKINRGLVS